MTTTKPTGKPVQVSDGTVTITAQKVFTRMGERLELTAEELGRSTRLDAIMLESVTWQDPDELARRGAEVDRPAAGTDPAPQSEPRAEPISISSEFAQAIVERTAGSDGDAIRIEAPKLGYDIALGPPALAWLSLQDHQTFTEWLEHPFGPGADDHDH